MDNAVTNKSQAISAIAESVFMDQPSETLFTTVNAARRFIRFVMLWNNHGRPDHLKEKQCV